MLKRLLLICSLVTHMQIHQHHFRRKNKEKMLNGNIPHSICESEHCPLAAGDLNDYSDFFPISKAKNVKNHQRWISNNH